MAGAAPNSLSSTRLILPPKSTVDRLFRRKSATSAAVFNHHCYAGLSTCAAYQSRASPIVSEGPSCIFVGPVESASQETLEALYRQAKDAYYSGKPLIMDDMFDRVELKLRWYGSKDVMKYPRCSLRRQSTYADAQGRKILHRCLLWQVSGF